MDDDLRKVLMQFDLAKIHDATPLSIGLIHKTYLVETDEGDFILQELHPVLSSDEIAKDFRAVTEHLKQKDFYSAELVTNKKGEDLTKIGKKVWRMQTALKGFSHDVIKSKKMAKNAGIMLARFHKVIADIDHVFKTDLILHETEKEYEKMITAAKKSPELLKNVQKEYNFLVKELPDLFLPANLEKRATHGDPKISNFLFDGFGNVLSVIDLDTCNQSSVLCDIGDALRSWCRSKEDGLNACFREDIYKKALNGYLKEADFLSKKELNLIPQAVACITLELGARFLADYFNDSYFGWNKERFKTRREHNYMRVQRQIAQYKDMKKKIL